MNEKIEILVKELWRKCKKESKFDNLSLTRKVRCEKYKEDLTIDEIKNTLPDMSIPDILEELEKYIDNIKVEEILKFIKDYGKTLSNESFYCFCRVKEIFL